MQSVIQKKSYGSVKIFWLNKELLLGRLKKAAEILLKENHNAEKVVLFGSLAQGKATAFSDADIMVIVSNSDKRFIDRACDFRKYFQDIGIEVDLFVYTKGEIERTPFADTAICKGKCIAS